MDCKKWTILFILGLAFAFRIWNFDFPKLSVEEARLSYRGFVIAQTGRDELGRNLPILFNSLEDYRLPLTSYITAAGIKVFGKNDFGTRMPFIVLGTMIPLLIYLSVLNIFKNAKVAFFSSLAVLFSPVLIFLSKSPNETIVSLFLICVIFYLFSQGKLNMIVILLMSILLLLVSKHNWLILPPFLMLLSLIFKRDLTKKIFIVAAAILLMSIVSIFIFMQIPNGIRSFEENNLTLFQDIGIKNGIEKLRMQGVMSGWPPLVERLLFNKLAYGWVGFLHWLSNLSPNFFFGQLDKSGSLNFSSMGVFVKISIVPFLFGLFQILQKGERKQRLLFLTAPVLTFPAMFIYPRYFPELLVLVTPFLAYVIGFGLAKLNYQISGLIISIMVLELVFNLVLIKPENKFTNLVRSGWVDEVSQDILTSSQKNVAAVSDDIVSDIIPYILWFNPANSKDNLIRIDWPYKYRQTSVDSIELIGADKSFIECADTERKELFLSNRDFEEVSKNFKISVTKKYQDYLGNNVSYKLSEPICIR